MNNELFELAIELAESAVEDIKGTGYRDSVPCLLDQLAEACGLLPLGETLKTALSRAIAGEPMESPTVYRLCDKTTGEPVDYSPDSTFDNVSDVQSANTELGNRGLSWRSERDIAQQRDRDREAERERDRWCLNDTERQALNEFAAANGRTWKRKLRFAWERCCAPEPLQYLSAHQCFGLAGLDRYKAAKPAARIGLRR